MQRVNSIKARSFLFLYTLVIFLLSFLPGYVFEAAPKNNFLDKIVHLLLYLILGFIAIKSFAQGKGLKPVLFFVSFVYCAVVGAISEYFQLYVPLRNPDIVDFVFNLTGVFSGFVVYILWFSICRDKK